MIDFDESFRGRGAQKRVAEHMLRHGYGVNEDGDLVCGGVKLNVSSLAELLSVDRRVVKSTVEAIMDDGFLREVYSRISPTVYLRDAAGALGFGVFQVIPVDASAKGIVADVSRVLAENEVGLRQVVADDPMLEDPQLTVVTEKPINKELLDKLLKLNGVEKITVLN